MTLSRVFWPLALTAFLAACSGNLGGGQSTLPGTPPGGTNVQQVGSVAATPTPVSASNVATIGDTVAPQALPMVMGWGGSIAFAKPSAAPSATPNPKSTAMASDSSAANAVSVGVTAGIVEPPDSPHFGSTSAKRHAKHDPSANTPLFFISLLATTDVTLGAYPAIAVDMPREIAAKHRDDTYALALFDPEQKDKTYHLAVAERDLSSPLPGSMPTPVATLVPTPTPIPTAGLGMPNGSAALTPPPVGVGLGGGSLPPEHVAFKSTATTLTLKANRQVVFALYAIPPQPSPSPSPAPSGSPRGAASAGPSPSPANGSSSAAPASTPSAPLPAPSPKSSS